LQVRALPGTPLENPQKRVFTKVFADFTSRPRSDSVFAFPSIHPVSCQNKHTKNIQVFGGGRGKREFGGGLRRRFRCGGRNRSGGCILSVGFRGPISAASRQPKANRGPGHQIRPQWSVWKRRHLLKCVCMSGRPLGMSPGSRRLCLTHEGRMASASMWVHQRLWPVPVAQRPVRGLHPLRRARFPFPDAGLCGPSNTGCPMALVWSACALCVRSGSFVRYGRRTGSPRSGAI
jgi:hypothetical protein